MCSIALLNSKYIYGHTRQLTYNLRCFPVGSVNINNLSSIKKAGKKVVNHQQGIHI
jgi:hypothetical protein